MSSKRDTLVSTAEDLFYNEGFHATGVDRVIAEAGVARMTLYKHFSSKDELVLAVLEHREQEYWDALVAAVNDARQQRRSTLLAIVESHGDWLQGGGTRGCLFMKALGEYAEHVPAIAEVVLAHKRRLLAWIGELAAEEGWAQDQQIAETLGMLLEGATACAQVVSPEHTARRACHAAKTLLGSQTTADGG